MQEAALHAFVASNLDSVSLLLILKHLGAQHTTLLFQYLLSWLRQLSGNFKYRTSRNYLAVNAVSPIYYHLCHFPKVWTFL